MNNKAKKYEILDDSYGAIHGKQVFQSDSRQEASDYYTKYETIGNNVALLQRNPLWIKE